MSKTDPAKRAADAAGAAPNPLPEPPPVTPYLVVSPAVEAMAFYERAFGGRVAYRQDTPDGGKVIHASVVLPNGGLFMLSDEFAEMGVRTPVALGGSPVTIHLDLPDVDTAWAQAVAAGATVLMPLADQFWGDRYGILADPFGHRWSLATRQRSPTAEELEAGAHRHFG